MDTYKIDQIQSNITIAIFISYITFEMFFNPSGIFNIILNIIGVGYLIYLIVDNIFHERKRRPLPSNISVRMAVLWKITEEALTTLMLFNVILIFVSRTSIILYVSTLVVWGVYLAFQIYINYKYKLMNQ